MFSKQKKQKNKSPVEEMEQFYLNQFLNPPQPQGYNGMPQNRVNPQMMGGPFQNNPNMLSPSSFAQPNSQFQPMNNGFTQPNPQFQPMNNNFSQPNSQFQPTNNNLPQSNPQFQPVNNNFSQPNPQFQPVNNNFSQPNPQFQPVNNNFSQPNPQFQPMNNNFSQSNPQFQPMNNNFSQSNPQFQPMNNNFSQPQSVNPPYYQEPNMNFNETYPMNRVEQQSPLTNQTNYSMNPTESFSNHIGAEPEADIFPGKFSFNDTSANISPIENLPDLTPSLDDLTDNNILGNQYFRPNNYLVPNPGTAAQTEKEMEQIIPAQATNNSSLTPVNAPGTISSTYPNASNPQDVTLSDVKNKVDNMNVRLRRVESYLGFRPETTV